MNEKNINSTIGKLFIVATPIGNLEDITYRAVRILKECDLIAAEDTRKAVILLNKYEIGHKKIISHHLSNEHKTKDAIIEAVLSGTKVAVITEAGTPCISDPGFLILREALKNNIKPEFIPGVSALTFAIMASCLPSERFVFYGFLPPKYGARYKILESISKDEKTAIIFESPNRIHRLLEEIKEVIGSNCGVALIREATKMYEEIIRGNAHDVLNSIKGRKIKGEIIVGMSCRYIPHSNLLMSSLNDVK